MSFFEKIIVSPTMKTNLIDIKDLEEITRSTEMFRIVGVQKNTDELNKFLHDLRSSHRTLLMLKNNLEEGYRFEDDLAEAKIKAVSSAIEKLEPYRDLVEKIFKG